MLLSSSGHLARLLAYAGAGLFIGAAASQNVSFGWQIGEAISPFHAAVLAAGSLAGAILCPFCFLTVTESFRNGGFGGAAAALAARPARLAAASVRALGGTPRRPP